MNLQPLAGQAPSFNPLMGFTYVENRGRDCSMYAVYKSFFSLKMLVTVLYPWLGS